MTASALRPLNICLIHTRIERRGGLETRLLSYIHYLVKAGHKVSVIHFKRDLSIELPSTVRLIRLNFKYIPKPIRAWVLYRRLPGMLKGEQFDFVLSLTRTANQDAVLAPANHIGFLKSKNRRFWWPEDWLSIYLEKQSFSRTCHVLAASTMMRDELIRYYKTPSEAIHLLPPPVDTARFNFQLRDKRGQLREKFGIEPGRFVVVFVGVAHERKGLPVLLKAFKQLPPEHFLLLVASPKKVQTDLPHVRDLGYIKETEELYTAADLLALPARYEPFGQVISESILCGTPVLISPNVGAKMVLSDNEGRIVESSDGASWAAAIREASKTAFKIDQDFAEKHRIRLEDHMQAILNLALWEIA